MNNTFNGKTFVFGTPVSASTFNSKPHFEMFVALHGGRVTQGVTRRTDFFVNNIPTLQTVNACKATELGIPVITEDELRTYAETGISPVA